MVDPELSVGALGAPILEANPASTSLSLSIGGHAIRVVMNSSELRDVLANYFRYWLAPANLDPDIVVTAIESDEATLPVPFVDWQREEGKTGRKDEYADIAGGRVVRKVRTGMQYLLGDGLRLVFGPCRRNDNQVINFVVAQFINLVLNRGRVLCHAAAVVAGDRGLALAGISGAGKSTLALRLMEHSLDFSSNDRLLVGLHRGRPWLWGVPKQPRINPGTALTIDALSSVVSPERRRELTALGTNELWELEEKYDVDIGSIFGESRWRADAPLSAFLLLRWHRDSNDPANFERVDLGERRDLLPILMKPPGPFYQPASGVPVGVFRQTEQEYLDGLDGVAVYEATGRVDFESAVRFCVENLLK